jgi:hypothetical protein
VNSATVNAKRTRDVGGDDDHAEGEVEIDARSDVGNGRDRQIYGAELP